MRMTKVDPRCLCRKHLVAEHIDMHLFMDWYKKKKNLSGYLRNGTLELHSIHDRHEALALELRRRGLEHNTPMIRYCLQFAGHIDLKESYVRQTKKCKACGDRMKDYGARIHRRPTPRRYPRPPRVVMRDGYLPDSRLRWPKPKPRVP